MVDENALGNSEYRCDYTDEELRDAARNCSTYPTEYTHRASVATQAYIAARKRIKELMILIAWDKGFHSDASLEALLGYDSAEARKRHWQAMAEGTLVSP